MRHVSEADAVKTSFPSILDISEGVKGAQEFTYLVLAKQSLCSYISS